MKKKLYKNEEEIPSSCQSSSSYYLNYHLSHPKSSSTTVVQEYFPLKFLKEYLAL